MVGVATASVDPVSFEKVVATVVAVPVSMLIEVSVDVVTGDSSGDVAARSSADAVNVAVGGCSVPKLGSENSSVELTVFTVVVSVSALVTSAVVNVLDASMGSDEPSVPDVCGCSFSVVETSASDVGTEAVIVRLTFSVISDPAVATVVSVILMGAAGVVLESFVAVDKTERIEGRVVVVVDCSPVVDSNASMVVREALSELSGCTVVVVSADEVESVVFVIVVASVSEIGLPVTLTCVPLLAV